MPKEVGMKSNDTTAHTALADCLTLRECMYRVFSKKTLEQIREVALQSQLNAEKTKLLKITRRLKF